MLNQFKIYIAIGLFILYSLGIWHVSHTYTEAIYLKKNLEVATKALEVQASNEETRDLISKKLEEGLASIKIVNTTINKEIQREIQTNTVYADCRTTDGVYDNYKHKLESQ